jgi:hypothetical protein
MTVKITKPEINVREQLNELKKPTGVAGEAMLRAETPQEQFNLIGAGRRNLIINGAMKVAQRGTSFTSHSGYTLDRYKGFGHTYNQIDNGDFYSLRMLWVTGTDANIYYPVELERGQLENGQTYTLSFKYKSAGTPMTLECFYRQSTSGSDVVSQIPVQTLPNSSEFTDYSITFTCSGRISAHGALNIRFGNASGTKEIANLQLELGKVATPFEHRSYGEELALCERYYQKSYDKDAYITGSTSLSGVGAVDHYGTSDATNVLAQVYFRTQMRDAPTVTTFDHSTSNGGNAHSGRAYINSNSGAASYNTTTNNIGTTGFRSYVPKNGAAWSAHRLIFQWQAVAEL